MTSHFQVAPLVASPCYPNSTVWSEENLVAIATGRLVTILNPSQLDGPRGLITIPSSPPFDIGVVDREELLTGCILPTSLSRDVRSYVRSIAWSQLGMAGNGGCLLAVCTTDGRVKLYRAPYCDFRSEWVELLDISEMLYHYFVSNEFDNLELGFAGISPERTVSIDDPLRDMSSNSVQEPQHRKAKHARKCTTGSDTIDQESSYEGSQDSHNQDIDEESSEDLNRRVTVHAKCTLMPWSAVEEGASVEVLKVNGLLRFWVRGRIERLDDRKALVQFTGTSADEMQEEWVALDFNGNNESQTSEEITTRQNHFLQKIRPCINAGNLPKEITMATHIEGSEQVPAEGQLVEAWISNRWVEGSFVGYNSTGLLVNFPGEYGRISLDPDNVRLAPIWNDENKSWCVTVAELEMEDQKVSQNGFVGSKTTIGREKIHCQETLLKSTEKAMKKRARDVLPSVISAEQYAIRSGLLSSLVVAWSPTMKHSFDGDVGSSVFLYSSSAILAVGGKSGKVSLWRVFDPQYYTIEHCLKPPEARLIGLFQAHKSWATAVSWAICTASVSDKMDVNTSSNKLLLATGSSDGSVKLWYGDPINLNQSHDDSPIPFSLLKEVIAVDSVPVSVLSLFVPSQSLDKVLIAIGKGSGQLSVWICYTSGRKCHMAGQFEAHDQVVTGLSWAFDGRCLYSCSQDNSVRSWIIHGSSLFPVPFPESSPGPASENSKNSIHLPSYVFDCCYGLAISPGNLVIAVVRSIDTDLVDPMYQSRSQKAAVEFFWVGGQQLKSSLGKLSECRSETYGGFSEKDVVCWESNILWSLKQFEDVTRPLVLWDILMALLALKVLAVDFFETILSKWFSSWFSGSRQACTLERCLIHLPRLLSKVSCRRIHLLDVICRRLLLAGINLESLNSGVCEVEKKEIFDAREKSKAWIKLLHSSEHELRERLVYLSLSAILYRASYPRQVCHPSKIAWVPSGAPQMDKWISLNAAKISDPLKHLAAQIRELGRKRISSISEYSVSERCTFCGASVQFRSPETAFCQAGRCDSDSQSHKLQRCAVSMHVCPATSLWFCICCERWVMKQAPDAFFNMSSLQDAKYLSEYLLLCGSPKPACPFCGILMQRFLPEFLLTTSPV
ncbi:uncharacterized protein LOC131033672 isoform X1 [Cryptomeria japonica]|uniref:uncharacterized protein LOC131033672 isoform X1 n=2 Tax=Cryptomeria japonica TaxID=3369 RepID=UPI0027DAAFAF|nr:uncharacterized protein LOC131033672 isoform X1 [Cryptomeria japonica]